MKKIGSIILAFVLALISALSLSACNPTKTPGLSYDENTINVRVRMAGYGKTYIEKLAEQFNKTFEEQGVKVNVVAPREDLTGDVVLRDIYSNSGIDVYFTDGVTAAQAANHKDYGSVIEDVKESVWDKKPIKFDGTEEDKTVGEKLAVFDESLFFHGNACYGLPYAASFGSLAVNKKVLDSYYLDLPRTTDEMFNCFDVIMEDAFDTAVFPVTYSLSDNNYTLSTINPWLAQYNGVEEYNQFWSFQYSDGTDMGVDSYKVFGFDSVKHALEVMYQFADYNTAAYGSGSHDFKTAQSLIMKGTAVFYSVGDWMFNEEFYGFPSYRKDVVCINAPVVSALGEKLFGPESSYGFTLEKADDVLSAIVKYVDTGIYAEQVKTLVDQELSVNIDIDDVTTVCERRGITRCNMSPGMLMSKKSTKKDIAALFMRFCASTDAGKLFAQESRSTSAFALNEVVESEYPWVNAQSVIANNKYFTPIQGIDAGWGYRTDLGVYGMFPAPLMNSVVFLSDIVDEMVTKFDDGDLSVIATNEVYKTAAANKVSYMYNQAKTALETGKWKVSK